MNCIPTTSLVWELANDIDLDRKGTPIVIFIDGCFWHGCPRHVTWPKTRAAFWRDKIAGNRARDRRVNRRLRALGWRVLRIWEHELTRRHEARLVRRLQRFLAGGT